MRRYNPPRTADGKPNFNGIWQVLNTANWDIQDHSGELGVPPGQGVVEGNEVPYQPWALAKKQENYAKRATALLRLGWRRDSLPVGLEVEIEGFRAKAGGPVANGRSIKLANGKELFSGGSAPQQ